MTREEEARFWETHSPADYSGAFEELTEPIEAARPIRHSMRIVLDSSVLERIHEIAASLGLSSAELVRTWTLDRVKQADGANRHQEVKEHL